MKMFYVNLNNVKSRIMPMDETQLNWQCLLVRFCHLYNYKKTISGVFHQFIFGHVIERYVKWRFLNPGSLVQSKTV